MNFHILTLFPNIFDSFIAESIISRALKEEKISIKTINIRDFSKNKHKQVDDSPYGGGPGMLISAPCLFNATSFVKSNLKGKKYKTVLFSPQGELFNQDLANNLKNYEDLILICGHYEGIDERFIVSEVDKEISIGNFILTGGETAAIVFIDCISRLIENVLGNRQSSKQDTFKNNLLKYAQYTRPFAFDNMTVPEVLLSGNHKEIEKVRIENSLKRTFLKRFDLLEKRGFSEEEKEILENWCRQIKELIN